MPIFSMRVRCATYVDCHQVHSVRVRHMPVRDQTRLRYQTAVLQVRKRLARPGVAATASPTAARRPSLSLTAVPDRASTQPQTRVATRAMTAQLVLTELIRSLMSHAPTASTCQTLTVHFETTSAVATSRFLF